MSTTDRLTHCNQYIQAANGVRKCEHAPTHIHDGSNPFGVCTQHARVYDRPMTPAERAAVKS